MDTNHQKTDSSTVSTNSAISTLWAWCPVCYTHQNHKGNHGRWVCMSCGLENGTLGGISSPRQKAPKP